MSANKQAALLQSEEKCKESVYKTFDKMRKNASDSVVAAQAKVDGGSYEDQEAFMVHDVLNGAWRCRHEAELLVQKLYKRPYFAHIEAHDDDSSYTEHYYLSDCESLDQMVTIENDGVIIPFKKDENRPISLALFHCYQDKKGDPVSYSAPGGNYVLIPQLICDDEIDNRHLLDAVQLFPKTEMLQITADELLEEKLRENRNNPTLSNIISTLQRMQFEIIEADVKQSFIVQGCAGSGKSQCLLHRLFFLRDSLSQEGWNHVLLLTPTQLFRNYSADLIRRYQLSSVENCSIADLYKKLLNAYDARFKNRQYRFELSEEYLPDEYLHEIYDASIIAKIDSEICNAIHKYVSNGCAALGIDMPDQITSVQVDELVKRLDEEIQEFDVRESVLQQDEKYAEKRRQYEELEKQLDSLQKRREKLTEDYNKIIEDSAKLESLLLAVREADQERSAWLFQREEERNAAIKELTQLGLRWNNGNDIQLPARYAQQLAIVQDMLYGERYKADEEYAHFLDDYCEQMRAELNGITKNQTTDKIFAKYEKRKADILQKSNQLATQIEKMTSQSAEYAEWLRNRSDDNEGEKSRRTLRRSEMERARYFLGRIESAVFEREVWNVITPLKEKYNIQTLQVEDLQDGHQRETRILYKSDVLFYLKIYTILHPDAKLPDYRLICVDEGQDLHKADYDMLRRLYPNAVLNVFGDTDQVLHQACGVHDWKDETGIEKEYFLNRNYRNTAAIVDFCNRNFGSSMEFVGKIKKNQQPRKIINPTQLKSVVEQPDITMIVKDRRALQQLCMKMGKPASDFEYLDTKTDKQLGGGIPCYSIFAAKGLEFTNVLVYAAGMTTNQKVVASTRAMEVLYYYE